MTKMIVRLSTLALLGMATYALAQAPAQQPVVKSDFQKVTATVEAINPATREVSLRGPDGPVSVVVGPDVKNFDKIHVGDKVVVSYYQGIAVQMAKGDVKATEPAAAAFAFKAQPGAKPGGGVGASVTTTVTILAINRETNTVAFKRADGSVHLIAVKSPNMVQFLHTLQPGDLVDVTYTESLAINVVPAGS
jgi:hypothetical protein